MAQNKNLFADLFSQNDFAKLFENYQSMPLDINTFLDAQRKNVEAFTEAQQLAMEGLQALAQRQSEFMSQIVDDNSKLAQELMAEGTPEEKIAKNAKMFKKAYEKNLKNLKELSDMISESNMTATDVINKRVSASINEIQTSMDKQKKAA